MRFAPKEAKLGFDAGVVGSLPWQMVPLYGARGLKVTGAAKLQIKIEPIYGSGASDGLRHSETQLYSTTDREIWIQGRAPGRYLVGAASSGIPVMQLEAHVLKERVVKIAYYSMISAQNSRWDIRKLHDMANAILFPQANVRLEFVGLWWPQSATSTFNPGGPVDLSSNAQRASLQDYGNNWNANLLVYFGTLKNLADKGGKINAQTAGNKTYVDSYSHLAQENARMARTLAHEIGHFICPDGSGHDGKATDLMYGDSSKTPGTEIRGARTRMIIRPY